MYPAALGLLGDLNLAASRMAAYYLVCVVLSRRLLSQEGWTQSDTITLPDWQKLDTYTHAVLRPELPAQLSHEEGSSRKGKLCISSCWLQRAFNVLALVFYELEASGADVLCHICDMKGWN